MVTSKALYFFCWNNWTRSYFHQICRLAGLPIRSNESPDSLRTVSNSVITSYSIHYTKLYDVIPTLKVDADSRNIEEIEVEPRITSYNVCYTKLLRAHMEKRISINISISQGMKLLMHKPL